MRGDFLATSRRREASCLTQNEKRSEDGEEEEKNITKKRG